MKSRSSSCAVTYTHFSNSQRHASVVVNLEYVRHLNAQAIGVLLAHHLRLDRAGGAIAYLPGTRPVDGDAPSGSLDDTRGMPPHPRRGGPGAWPAPP